MALVYRTDGAWGSGKGVNLVPAEVDENFYDLDGRIEYLQDNPPEAIYPTAINIEGGLFTMQMSDGTTLGPIVMTMPVPRWRGNWAPATAYLEMDFFIAPDDGMGAVMVEHTSAATFDWGAIDTGTSLPIYQLLVASTGGGGGTGTVTSIATADGITGGPITTTGTIRLASVATMNLLANLTGGTAAPTAVTLSAILDAIIGSARGSFLQRGASGWAALTPGTAGQFLKTGGAGADATWDSPAGAGTVTSVAAGTGLAASPSPIVGAGTMSLATIGDDTILANISGGTAAPSATTLTALLDSILGTTQGAVIYRGASLWAALGPGTSGHVLTSGGASANPAWSAAAGGSSLPSGAADDQLIYVSGAWTAQRPRYIVSCFVPGVPAASQLLLLQRLSKAVTIPANFGAYLGHTSMARGTVAATASTAFDVRKATSASPASFSSVGTITVASAGLVATFTSVGGTAITFAQGDSIEIVGPASPDATFADFAASLVGYET